MSIHDRLENLELIVGQLACGEQPRFDLSKLSADERNELDGYARRGAVAPQYNLEPLSEADRRRANEIIEHATH